LLLAGFFWVQTPVAAKRFSFSQPSRQELWLSQPPVQWAPGLFTEGSKVAGGMALTTHTHLALRLRIVQLYLYTSSMHASHVTARLYLLSSVHLHLFSWEYLPITPGCHGGIAFSNKYTYNWNSFIPLNH